MSATHAPPSSRQRASPARPHTARARTAAAQTSQSSSASDAGEASTPQLFRDAGLQSALRVALGARSTTDQAYGSLAAVAASSHADRSTLAAIAAPAPSGAVAALGRKSASHTARLRPGTAGAFMARRGPSADELGSAASAQRIVSFGKTMYAAPGSALAVQSAAVRPKSARTTTTTPAAAAKRANTAAALDDASDDEARNGFPSVDVVPIPASAAAALKTKATYAQLGVHFDDREDEVKGWSQAAQLRAVPLEVDQEQTMMHASLHDIELARRKMSRSSQAHRDALEARPRPWRSGDALERDARWEGADHRNAVNTLRASLDHTLATWRKQQEPLRRAAYEHLPERDVRRNPETGAAEPQLPDAPYQHNDFLYSLLLQLENMTSEMRVYDEVFRKITLPTSADCAAPGAVATPAELGNVACPSAPLRDLLDRIRVAHTAFYPRFDELFAEVRRRLKMDWLLREMGRRKDTRMQDTAAELDAWDAQLEAEQARSNAMSADLQRTKDALVKYSDEAFHAPIGAASEATLLYDPRRRKLRKLTTRAEIEAVKLMPTQYFGEQEPDGGDEDDALDSNNNASTTAAAAEARKQAKQRAQVAEAQSAWRAKRLAQLEEKELRTGSLAAHERMERSKLQSEQHVAAQLAQRLAEEKAQQHDHSTGDSEEESTDSDSTMAPSAGVLKRRARLAALPPAVRVQKQYTRVSRAIARSFTTRPLLQVHALESGARVQGRVFTNSMYFTFELAPGDAGIWARVFASEAGTQEEHLELMLACGAPPTRRSRFCTTATRDGATHCAIDLRDGEMVRAASLQQEQTSKGGETAPARRTSRWYLRVVGRGLRLKSFTLEFRIHTSLANYGEVLSQALDDLESQSHWQDRLHDKALVVQHQARASFQARLKPEKPAHDPDSECELDG